jgi:acyl dehydratase
MTAGVVNPGAMSYRYDRPRFIRPVFIRDTIRVVVTVKEKRDEKKRPGYGIVVEGCEVLNQHNETVLACEHIFWSRGGTVNQRRRATRG